MPLPLLTISLSKVPLLLLTMSLSKVSGELAYADTFLELGWRKWCEETLQVQDMQCPNLFAEPLLSRNIITLATEKL